MRLLIISWECIAYIGVQIQCITRMCHIPIQEALAESANRRQDLSATCQADTSQPSPYTWAQISPVPTLGQQHKHFAIGNDITIKTKQINRKYNKYAKQAVWKIMYTE